MSESLVNSGGEPTTEQTVGAVSDPQTGDRGSVLTGQDAGEPKWYEGLADDLKGDERIKGYGSVEEMAKAHLEALSKLPVVPEEYEIKVPEGHPVNEALVKQAKEWFKGAGLTAEQAQKVAEGYVAAEQQMMVDFQKQEEEGLAALRKEYGSKWAAEFSLASKTFARFATGAEAEAFEKSGLGNNPLLIRFFNRMGRNLSEGEFVEGSPLPRAEVQRDKYGQPTLRFND